MRGALVFVSMLSTVSIVALGCTHDFDAFSGGAPSDATPSDQGTADSSAADSSTPSDSSTADTSTPPDGTTADTAPPPTDTTPPTDGAPPCSDPEGVLFGGHCYFPLSTAATWDTAKAACAGTSAHLVTITSSAEESFVETIKPGSERWIGLSRPTGAPPKSPSSFGWVTGETLGFQKWAPSEPNGSGACVRLEATNDWGDQSCTTVIDAICERE